MSDISDVLVTLAKHVASLIYPLLTYDQINENWDTSELWDLAKGKSTTGKDVKIYPGWPNSSELDADLANGISHVTVFPATQERNTTRYPEREHVMAAAKPTLALTIAGPVQLSDQPGFYDQPGVIFDTGGDFDEAMGEEFVVFIGGAVAVPQNIALRINGKFYVYSVQADDTFATIAAALAALIPGASASGSAITLSPTSRLQAARVGAFGTVAKEVRRQERVVQIIVWSDEPDVRDQLAGVIDVDLAERRFLTMPDGFGARIIYKNSAVIDALQKANLYRRDLNYLVEYATTVSKQRAAVIAPSANINEIVVTA